MHRKDALTKGICVDMPTIDWIQRSDKKIVKCYNFFLHLTKIIGGINLRCTSLESSLHLVYTKTTRSAIDLTTNTHTTDNKQEIRKSDIDIYVENLN